MAVMQRTFGLLLALLATHAGLTGDVRAQARPSPAAGLYGPAPGRLPAGVYNGTPAVRLTDGRLLWSTGDLATGEGVAQASGSASVYGQVARAGDGMVVCGLRDVRSTYFSGDLGRRSCLVFDKSGGREVFATAGRRLPSYHDMVVRGQVMVLSDRQQVWAVDLRGGRLIGRRAYDDPTVRGLLPRIHLIDSSRRRSASVLLNTPEGVVLAFLVKSPAGWSVQSQQVRWTSRGVQLQPPKVAPAPAEVSAVLGNVVDPVRAGLDGRRFFFAPGYLQRPSALIELSGSQPRVGLRWSGQVAELPSPARVTVDSGVAVIETSYGGYAVDLRPDARLRPLDPPPPACAAPPEPGARPRRRLLAFPGPRGLELLSEWAGRTHPRCWTTTPVLPAG